MGETEQTRNFRRINALSIAIVPHCYGNVQHFGAQYILCKEDGMHPVPVICITSECFLCQTKMLGNARNPRRRHRQLCKSNIAATLDRFLSNIGRAINDIPLKKYCLSLTYVA